MKLHKALGLLAFLFGALSAGAQTYPSQPIKLIMPFAPGTASENAMRLVLDKLSENLKQPVVLENRPGAGSTLGTDQAAKAVPDGHTLLASYNSAIAPGALLYNKLGYDPLKDFKHIALIGVFPQFMVVRSDHPAKTVQDFLAMVRAKPGAVNYSSAGVGTSGFLAAEMLKQALQIGEGIAGRTLLKKQAAWIYDLKNEIYPFDQQTAEHFGFHSTLAFPVLFNNEVFGICNSIVLRPKRLIKTSFKC